MSAEMEAGPEMDALIAERLFRFTWVPQPKDVDGKHAGELVLMPPGGSWEMYESVLPRRGKIGPHFFLPRASYSADRDGAALVEDEIWRREASQVGIAASYLGSLGYYCRLKQMRETIPVDDVLVLLRATPLQQCRAALGTIEMYASRSPDASPTEKP